MSTFQFGFLLFFIMTSILFIFGYGVIWQDWKREKEIEKQKNKLKHAKSD